MSTAQHLVPDTDLTALQTSRRVLPAVHAAAEEAEGMESELLAQITQQDAERDPAATRACPAPAPRASWWGLLCSLL